MSAQGLQKLEHRRYEKSCQSALVRSLCGRHIIAFLWVDRSKACLLHARLPYVRHSFKERSGMNRIMLSSTLQWPSGSYPSPWPLSSYCCAFHLFLLRRLLILLAPIRSVSHIVHPACPAPGACGISFGAALQLYSHVHGPQFTQTSRV